MIPLKKFLDPSLFIGLGLLLIYKYSRIWLGDNSPDPMWRTIMVNGNWIAGVGGLIAVIIGIVRPAVRAMLEGQFLVALVFYGVFWFVLSIPAFSLGFIGKNMAAARLYGLSLLILFCFTSLLTGMSFLFARYVLAKK